MDDSLVSLRDVAVSIGGVPILRSVQLTVSPGESVGISGANGSGKTTLLRVVATLLRPSAGTGRVLGHDLLGAHRFAARPRIELVGHRPALYPQLTLEENLAFCASVNGADKSRVSTALHRVGLAAAAHRRAEQASQGMQRRIEFARVWLTGPRLLLLDEAHAGLDDEASALVADAIAGVAASGGAVIVVSHDARRAAPLVDRQLHLEAGTVVAG